MCGPLSHMLQSWLSCMVIINCCVGILLLLMIQDEKRDRALVRDVLIPYPSLKKVEETWLYAIE